MKRTWTKQSALNWVTRVKNGSEKRGLKYCSAMSYLSTHHGIGEANFEAAVLQQLIDNK